MKINFDFQVIQLAMVPEERASGVENSKMRLGHIWGMTDLIQYPWLMLAPTPMEASSS